MMNQLHFLRPDWFYAYIPFGIILLFLLRNTFGSSNWRKVCDPKLLPYILIDKKSKKSYVTLLITSLVIALAILAAAGPVWKKLPTPVFREQSSLVIALDLSRSMDSTDIRPSRLERAKLKIIDILNRRKDGQTALIAYAASAFTVTPLSDDTETISNLITALQSELMPSQGSSAQDALKLSKTLLHNAGVKRGDVLLVTDSIKESDFYSISELTSDSHRVSILAIGTRDGGPIALGGGFLKDSSGSIVISKIDTEMMIRAAKTGNGMFSMITSNDADINALTSLFDEPTLNRDTEETDLKADIWHEEGPWLLLFLLPFVAYLSRRGTLIALVILITPLPDTAHAFSFNDLWLNKDQRAVEAFRNGDHEAAAQLFSQPDWKASAFYKNGDYQKAIDTLDASGRKLTSDDLYNKANALAQLQRYEESIYTYDQALKLDPGNVDAEYNREIVSKLLQNKQQNETKDQDSKDQRDPQDQQQSSQQQQQSGEQQKDQNKNQSGDMQSQNMSDEEAKDPSAKEEDIEEDKDSEKQAKEEEEDGEETTEKAQELAQKDLGEPTEEMKANEKWLNRIVDDPGGLLRRKFIYQYKKMDQDNQNREPW